MISPSCSAGCADRRFFNTQLRPYVDVSGSVWKGQPVEGVPPRSRRRNSPSSSAPLRSAICSSRQASTRSGRFDLTPVLLDEGAKQVTLELAEYHQLCAWATARHADHLAGPSGMSIARLVFDRRPPPVPVFQATGRGRSSGCSIRELTAIRLGGALPAHLPPGERQAVFEIRAARYSILSRAACCETSDVRTSEGSSSRLILRDAAVGFTASFRRAATRYCRPAAPLCRGVGCLDATRLDVEPGVLGMNGYRHGGRAVWRFALCAGICGPDAALGLWMRALIALAVIFL